MADVYRYNDYNIHPFSKYKRFWTDEKAMDDFIRMQPKRNYTKTFIDLPADKLGCLERNSEILTRQAEWFGIDVYENPEFYDWFDIVNIME